MSGLNFSWFSLANELHLYTAVLYATSPSYLQIPLRFSCRAPSLHNKTPSVSSLDYFWAMNKGQMQGSNLLAGLYKQMERMSEVQRVVKALKKRPAARSMLDIEHLMEETQVREHFPFL